MLEHLRKAVLGCSQKYPYLFCRLPTSSKNFKPLRQQALTRYVGFYSSLLSSPCKEVAVVSRIVGRNASTTTGRNLLNLQLETGLNTRVDSLGKFKDHFQAAVEPVPKLDVWRIPLLTKYLKIRQEQNAICENTDYINSLISSLCSSQLSFPDASSFLG